MNRDKTTDVQDGTDPHAGHEKLRSIETRELLGDGREIVILHNGERYRLRVTQNGKLILTK